MDRSSIPAKLTAAPERRFAAGIEAAAYFVVAEALTNAARYSEATGVEVRASVENGMLRVVVKDDGRGGGRPARLWRGRDRGPGRRRGRQPQRHQSRRARHDGEGGHPVRIVIADDAVLLREGAARLLEDAGFEVVGQAGDADDLLRKVRAHKPDVAVVDVRMPPDNTDDGLRAALAIRSELPEVGILLLSQYVEDRYIGELLAGGTEGVGYLLKDRVAEVDRFTEAVSRVAGGGSVLDPEVVAQMVGAPRGAAQRPHRSRA